MFILLDVQMGYEAQRSWGSSVARNFGGIKRKKSTAWPKENNVRHSQLLPTVRPLVAVVVALAVFLFLDRSCFGVLVFSGGEGKTQETAAEMVYCLIPLLFCFCLWLIPIALCLSCQPELNVVKKESGLCGCMGVPA